MMHERKAASPLENIFNDAFFSLIGFTVGSLFSILGTYGGRTYVRERLRNEKEIKFSRKQFLQYHHGELLDDYKHLSQYNPHLLSDQDLNDLRRLETEDLEKVRKLREIHDEFAKDNDNTRTLTMEEIIRRKEGGEVILKAKEK